MKGREGKGRGNKEKNEIRIKNQVMATVKGQEGCDALQKEKNVGRKKERNR